MKNIKEQIIEKIRDNKISTTEVADALGKTGHVPGPLPMCEGLHKVGEVAFVYAYNKSNWEVHEQIEKIGPGKIVYVHSIDCEDRAIFGNLVAKYLLLYKQCVAIVVNGLMRDCHTIIKEKYPVWCTGVSPIGCVNVKNTRPPDAALLNELTSKYEGGVMVSDDSGVVFIEKERLNEDLLKKLDLIELQEDVWFFCLDTHKMSTYEIVCQKKYLDESRGLIHKDKLVELSDF